LIGLEKVGKGEGGREIYSPRKRLGRISSMPLRMGVMRGGA